MPPLSPALGRSVENYRRQVLGMNLRTISRLLNYLETGVSHRNISASDAQAAVVRALETTYLRANLSSQISFDVPRDILATSNHAVLAEAYDLDGIQHGPLDANRRGEWLAVIKMAMARLKTENQEGWEWPDDLPADLTDLIKTFRGINGPGLPYALVRGITPFFSIEIDLESTKKTEARVFVPARNLNRSGDELGMVWEEWDVAVAVRIGMAEMGPGVMMAVFCKDEELDEPWGWRFGVCEEDWSGGLFATVESFLEWFAGYGEQTDNDIRQDLVDISGRVAFGND